MIIKVKTLAFCENFMSTETLRNGGLWVSLDCSCKNNKLLPMHYRVTTQAFEILKKCKLNLTLRMKSKTKSKEMSTHSHTDIFKYLNEQNDIHAQT